MEGQRFTLRRLISLPRIATYLDSFSLDQGQELSAGERIAGLNG
jgi:hypothetical protein